MQGRLGAAGVLVGTKTILKELIACIELAALPPEARSAHSWLIMLYMLCGFANLVGGLTTMAPGGPGRSLSSLRTHWSLARWTSCPVAAWSSCCLEGAVVLRCLQA